MTRTLAKIFGPSWQTTLAGLIGGLLIVAWPVLQSAIQTQMTGVQVNWNNVLLGVVIAVGGYLAKDRNVSNSPNPLLVGQTVVPIVNAQPPPAFAQPAVIPKPEPPPGKF